MDGYKLSPEQQRLWLLAKQGSNPFHTTATIRIEGALDRNRLVQAIQDVVARYEILRTTFREAPPPDGVMQVIEEPGAALELEVAEAGAVENALSGRRISNGEKVVDRPPVLRVALQPEPDGAYRLWFTLPALCADARSVALLAGEFARAYARPLESSDQEVLQYADIAAWQLELSETPEAEDGRRYWRRQPWAEWPQIRLPFERKENRQHFAPASHCVVLPPALCTRLRDRARRHATGTASLLLASYGILLGRITGEERFLIGVGTSGRSFDELQSAPGLFARHLPLRCTLRGSESFSELCAQFDSQRQAGEQWQDFFSYEHLNGVYDAHGDEPYFRLCFEHEFFPEAFASDGVTFVLENVDAVTNRFVLCLACYEFGDRLLLAWNYDSKVLPAEEVVRLAGHYTALLDGALSEPEKALRRLPALSAQEHERTVLHYNETASPYPTDRCIHHIIEQQARERPDAIAIEAEGVCLSYGDLNRRANQLAHRLRKLDVGPDVLTAICLERSPEMLIAVLGVLKAGGAYVPLSPNYPEERLAFMLEDTRAPVLVSTADIVNQVKLSQHASRLQIVCLDHDWPEIAKESPRNPNVPMTPDNLIYVIYTSGSTGKPKGVLITHQGLVISNAARMAYFRQEVTKFLLLSSLSFDSSVVGIFWTLCTGGTLFLVPEESQQNVPDLVEKIAGYHVTHLLTLPSYYALLLEYGRPEALQSLRTAIVAGEACPKKMVDRHRHMLPGTALYSEYGATETTVFSSVYDCLKQTLNTAPVGDPVDNIQMYVLNEGLQPQPVWAPGEMHFGGAALSNGYLNRPELTAERFIPNPFAKKTGERLYKSGDLTRHLPNGDIEFLGRIDNQVKIRGFRVELEEIDAVLATHPAVREVCVDARLLAGDDPTSGRRLVAYVALAERSETNPAALRHYLADRLPDYMVPAQFVMLDSLPKNPNGKIDRRALPDPEESRPEPDESYAAPQSYFEKKLAEIWARVLRVEKVGIHDNFFELGGDSILSIQIISRAKQAGLELSPAHIFQYQTIAELARVAGQANRIHAEQGIVTGPVPLTPIQYWFFEKNLPNPHHWNVSLLLELRRDLPDSHLQQAAQALLAHHDLLRCRYDLSSAAAAPEDNAARSVSQTITAPGERCPFDRIDLSHLTETEEPAAIEAKIAEWQGKLNLEYGPLMRLVRLERGTDKNPYLLLVLHHLVCDVVSWRVLIEDLQRALQQLDKEQAIDLPAKTTSFQYWAKKLVAHAGSDAVRNELDYWQRTLARAETVLPFDFEADLSANTEASTRMMRVYLTVEETQALLQEIPKRYKTQINDVLLTALVQAFRTWTGKPGLLIDLEGHGREVIFDDVDLSRTVGWFTSSFPAYLHLENEPEEIGAAGAVQMIQQQLQEIPGRGFGYGLLRYLQKEETIRAQLRALPRPLVNFNYLGQFDQTLDESSPFALVQDFSMNDRAPEGPRSHVLEIVGAVIDEQLQFEWYYSANLHRLETIQRLTEAFLAALREIIALSKQPDAQAFTAEDFADFQWEEGDLTEIMSAIGKAQQGNTSDT